MTRTRRYDLI